MSFVAYRFLAVAVIAGALVSPVLAQEGTLRGAAGETVACLEIDGADQRLACFETAAGKLSAALTTEDEKPAPPAQPVAPAASGTAPGAEDDAPSWARAPAADSETAAEEITISVARILRNNVGRHFFITEDGQEWEQTIAERVKAPSSLPATATIEQTLFGSLVLRFEDGPSGSYKVRRTK